MVGSRGESPETHQRRFLLGQSLITQDHFRQVLGLSGVDPAVRVKPELARHRALDTIYGDFEAASDFLGRKSPAFPLCFSGRRVLARGFQPSVDPRPIHHSRLSIANVSN
jgi:hypothetical protein